MRVLIQLRMSLYAVRKLCSALTAVSASWETSRDTRPSPFRVRVMPVIMALL